ncbi:hypothetical protein [Jeotgalibacillus soli]|uniref:hypothetical protein n=1 Tax=Jeotgalibacillus soli TaxID=889306 RepID=UPI000597D6EF|nr:hypothetical protein [Jeotgalibacillus soli]
MDLDIIWSDFIARLAEVDKIDHASWKRVAGIPFLYISAKDIHKEELTLTIRKCAAKSMKGKRLHSETIPVRSNGYLYVFRHRFYVPQMKMFCCGNLCIDCIRFNER